MSGLIPFGSLVVVLLAGVVIALLLGTLWRAPTTAGQPVPVGVRRWVALWRWGGVLAGAVLAVLTAHTGALGRGLLLAAPLFGLAVLIGVLLGELTVKAPSGATRRAEVSVRRVRDYLPRALSTVVAIAGTELLVLLVLTTAAGSADDLGRAGRSLARRCSREVSESHGPWAGSFYSAPLALILGLGLAAAILTLHRIVRRPRPGDPDLVAAADDALRRGSARAVVGACGVLLTIPLIGVSLVTAGALHGISCRPAWWDPAAITLTGLVPVWLGVLAWSAVVVLLPSPARRPATPPLAPARPQA